MSAATLSTTALANTMPAPPLSDFYRYQKMQKSADARETQSKRHKSIRKRAVKTDLPQLDFFAIVLDGMGGYNAHVKHKGKTVLAKGRTRMEALANLEDMIDPSNGEAVREEVKTQRTDLTRRRTGCAATVLDFAPKPDIDGDRQYAVRFTVNRDLTRGDFERAVCNGFPRYSEITDEHRSSSTKTIA